MKLTYHSASFINVCALGSRLGQVAGSTPADGSACVYVASIRASGAPAQRLFHKITTMSNDKAY